MDAAEFVEQYLGRELAPWQRKALRAWAEAERNLMLYGNLGPMTCAAPRGFLAAPEPAKVLGHRPISVLLDEHATRKAIRIMRKAAGTPWHG